MKVSAIGKFNTVKATANINRNSFSGDKEVMQKQQKGMEIKAQKSSNFSISA